MDEPRIFQATGLGKEDADLVADTLVAADARGVLPTAYCASLCTPNAHSEAGCVDTKAKPALLAEHLGTAVVEGNNAMDQSVGAFAMKVAIQKAKEHGVSLSRPGAATTMAPALAYYSMMALPENMIGFSASIGGGNPLWPLGRERRASGQQPLWRGHSGGNRYPVVLDMAQSVVAKGKIVMATKTKAPSGKLGL